MQPTRAGERPAIFFPFLNIAFAIRGTDEQRVITRRGGTPLRFPERPRQIATRVINLRVAPGLAIIETEFDAGDAAVAAECYAFHFNRSS